jgi:hypothetical protein
MRVRPETYKASGIHLKPPLRGFSFSSGALVATGRRCVRARNAPLPPKSIVVPSSESVQTNTLAMGKADCAGKSAYHPRTQLRIKLPGAGFWCCGSGASADRVRAAASAGVPAWSLKGSLHEDYITRSCEEEQRRESAIAEGYSENTILKS